MKFIKNICFFIIISIIIVTIGYLLDSIFLFSYLKSNIIGLLLTLLAINTATSGLIASKIQDILVKYPKLDFSRTTREMRISLLEQIVLIAISIIVLMFQDSQKIVFEIKESICNVILVVIFIYSVDILWDTGKAVFIIIDEIQKGNNNDKTITDT
ncbi:hypothetical protein SAMN05216357_1103 [Porphyromonadaceae bacterium KH3CP3RA]|nr:hypothetical protein SAMN05216357_1103 [Porphyromonadaceae bacterium KH3CP3RA]